MLLSLEDTVIYGETGWSLQYLLFAASMQFHVIIFVKMIFVIKIAGSLSMAAKEIDQIICNPAKENWMK